MIDTSDLETMSSGEATAWMGTDAERWAAAFVHFNPSSGFEPTPGDTLHGWFCNAIEAGRSAGYSEGLQAR